jgi:hypothetical protein
MAINHTTIQKYINDVITSKIQPYAFIGSTDKTLTTDTVDSQLNVWSDSLFASKITKKDIVGVVPNVTYQSGTVYIPWSSNKINTGKYYAYNKTSGIVYLCLSDNLLNRTDYLGKNASTKIPTHDVGSKLYEDGYTWMPLYRITAPLLKFVTDSWIPVISLEDFVTEFEGTAYEQLIRFGSVPGATGNCGIYFKENTEVPSTANTNTTYSSGALFSTISDITCKECYWLFRNNPAYTSIFTGSVEPSASITIYDRFDAVGNMVNQNLLSSSSPYYHLYNMALNGLSDGAIISCFIDLTGLTPTQLTTTEANPTVSILTSDGVDGVVKLNTYITSSGTNVINGITIVNRGSNYTSATPYIAQSIVPNISVDTLLSKISVNLDYVDSLHIDPVRTLNCSTTSTLVRISTDDLVSNSIKVPSNINFYGLVDNPKRRVDGNLVNLDTKNNANSTLLVDNTTTFTVTAVFDNRSAFQNINKSTNLALNDVTKLTKIQQIKANLKESESPTFSDESGIFIIPMNGVNNSPGLLSDYTIMTVGGVTGATGQITSFTTSDIAYNQGTVVKVAKITGLNLTESSKIFSLNSIDHRQ